MSLLSLCGELRDSAADRQGGRLQSGPSRAGGGGDGGEPWRGESVCAEDSVSGFGVGEAGELREWATELRGSDGYV